MALPRGARLSSTKTSTSQGKSSIEYPGAETETTTIAIPKALYQRIEGRLDKTDFQSVKEYVAYVLDQVLLELESAETEKTAKRADNTFSKEDQENVEQRLRDLGYL